MTTLSLGVPFCWPMSRVLLLAAALGGREEEALGLEPELRLPVGLQVALPVPGTAHCRLTSVTCWRHCVKILAETGSCREGER